MTPSLPPSLRPGTDTATTLPLIVRRGALAAAAALALLGTAVQATPTYTATLLALPENTHGSRAFGLSGGVVVGQVTAEDGLPRAVVWVDPASPVLLSAGAFESTALAVSASVVVGARATAATSTEFDALRWASDAAAPMPLGAAGGAAAARAAMGSFSAGSLDMGAFVYDAFSDTLSLFDAPGAVAHGVNAAGVAVGQNAAGLPVAFNGTVAGFVDVLGTAADATGSAYAVLGEQVVGSYDAPDTLEQKAFLMRLGEAAGSTLFAGAAFALNALGDVVGADFNAGLAMFYSGGTAYDLNQLVGSGLAGYTLTQARAIDELGRIVAFGVDAAGNERAFLLRRSDIDPPPPAPVPAPGTLLLSVAALWLLRQRRA